MHRRDHPVDDDEGQGDDRHAELAAGLEGRDSGAFWSDESGRRWQESGVQDLDVVVGASGLQPLLEELKEDLEEKDDKRRHETKEEPDVDHFEVRRLRQRGGNALVEGVHDQHWGQRNHDGRVKVWLVNVER